MLMKINNGIDDQKAFDERNRQEENAIRMGKQAASDESTVRDFLFSVMNDEAAAMSDRIKAADSIMRNAERLKANGEKAVKERIDRSLAFDF